MRATDPPCGRVVRVLDIPAAMIDPASDAEPEELTGGLRYSNLEAARQTLRGAIAVPRLLGGSWQANHVVEAVGIVLTALGEHEARKERLERELEDLKRRVATTRRVYRDAPGTRATGRKERALRRLFDEPEPRNGRWIDGLRLAVDYLHLTRKRGTAGLPEPGTDLVYKVPGCPKTQGEAFEILAWWHGIQNSRAARRALLRWIYAPGREHQLERIRIQPLLEKEFPQRPRMRSRVSPRLRKLPRVK